jgi:alanine racemase
MPLRSEVTIDLGAVRHNARRLLEALADAEFWAVVKADAYGHGAPEVARAALEEGAAALCVSTVGEGASLRAGLPHARIVVMGPCPEGELERARRAELELAISEPPFPMDVPIHLKIDTGMGRYGMQDVPAPPPNAVALMSHLATADVDEDFAGRQLERFRAAAESMPQLEAPRLCASPARPSRPHAVGSPSTDCPRSAPTRPTTASGPCSRGAASSRR